MLIAPVTPGRVAIVTLLSWIDNVVSTARRRTIDIAGVAVRAVAVVTLLVDIEHRVAASLHQAEGIAAVTVYPVAIVTFLTACQDAVPAEVGRHLLQRKWHDPSNEHQRAPTKVACKQRQEIDRGAEERARQGNRVYGVMRIRHEEGADCAVRSLEEEARDAAGIPCARERVAELQKARCGASISIEVIAVVTLFAGFLQAVSTVERRGTRRQEESAEDL